MRVIEIPNGFEPRPYQRLFMEYMNEHAKSGRAILIWHRRSGKDLTALHQTCVMMHERKGVYWHVYPTAEQARKALWEGFTSDGQRIMEQVFPKEIRKSPRDWFPNAEMVVELKCGSIWRLLGSDRVEVVGAGPVGVVFSEYAMSKPQGWDFISPMLRENDGWAVFVTTPRGNNHAKKLYDKAKNNPTWFCDLRTLYDTRAYDPERTISEERAEGKPESTIRQEYLCDWNAADVGSVWGDLLEGLEKRGGIGVFEHPKDGVFTSWDLGISDAMAIWFWRLNKDNVPDLIDHYEATGRPISHFMDEVDARGYQYVRHWFPHDARARTFQTGASTIELVTVRWLAEKVSITPELSLADGIQAARWLLQQPIRIHSRCEAGLDALRAYHYKWDDDRKVLSSKPEHDWSSHTSDAFRYVACAVRSSDVPRPKVDNSREPVLPKPQTLDDLWAQQRRTENRRI